jgi:hypothetical protein
MARKRLAPDLGLPPAVAVVAVRVVAAGQVAPAAQVGVVVPAVRADVVGRAAPVDGVGLLLRRRVTAVPTTAQLKPDTSLARQGRGL